MKFVPEGRLTIAQRFIAGRRIIKMRGCDPASAAAKLELAMDLLNRARADAASVWDDAMSQTFEKQFLSSLEPKVKRALDAIHHLAESISKAERECS